jgi:RHS repeat-associated protein
VGSGKLSIRTQGDTLGASSRVQWYSGNATTSTNRPKLSLTFAAATIQNQTPTANAGPDQTVTSGTLTTLSGGDSYDAESGVAYAWTPATTNPETVTLSSSTVSAPTFTPTKTGQYRFSLVVTDGSSVASAADEVIVNVVKELSASSTSFTYDGNGDRVIQTKGGVDTTYVVDSSPDNERVLMETTASATTYYVYGHDMLYSIDTAGPHYQHNDSLGSVVAITDGSGAVERTYDYDVFGVMRAASGTSGNRYTFTGEENDASGLVYLRARFYDPASGRFLSRDPFPADASDNQTLNRYAYVKTIRPITLTQAESLR